MNLRTKVSGFIVLTIVAAGVLPAALATAARSTTSAARLPTCRLRSTRTISEIVALSERLNGARIRLDQAQAGIVDAERRTEAAIARPTRIRNLLNARAAQIYKGAGRSSPARRRST